ncbi:hypothetical protein VTL71DRAFT_10382 [Oculimacula yallundae]|uniref:Uncharacterized protein n=1 Tax=Oculimacula yallundae TaxID=86028 RepID=A0ABR4CUK6_9HELO
MDDTFFGVPWTRVHLFIARIVWFAFTTVHEYLREFLQEDVSRFIGQVLATYAQSTWVVVCYTLLYTDTLFLESLHFVVHTLTWILMSIRLCLIATMIYGTGYISCKILLLACQYPPSLVVVIIALAGIPQLLESVEPLFPFLNSLDNVLSTFIRWMHTFFRAGYVQSKEDHMHMEVEDMEVEHVEVQDVEVENLEDEDLDDEDEEVGTQVPTVAEQAAQTELMVRERLEWLRGAQQNFLLGYSKDQVDESRKIRATILARLEMLNPASSHWKELKKDLENIQELATSLLWLPLQEDDQGMPFEAMPYLISQCKEDLWTVRTWEAVRESKMAYELRRLDSFDHNTFEEGYQILREQLHWMDNDEEETLLTLNAGIAGFLDRMDGYDPAERSWQKSRELADIIEIHKLRDPLGERLASYEQFVCAEAHLQIFKEELEIRHKIEKQKKETAARVEKFLNDIPSVTDDVKDWDELKRGELGDYLDRADGLGSSTNTWAVDMSSVAKELVARSRRWEHFMDEW